MKTLLLNTQRMDNGGGSVVVNPDGSVTITPAAGKGVTVASGNTIFDGAMSATANSGKVSAGDGPFDGAAAGFFAGSANGTVYAGNTTGTFTGNLLDLQLAGVSKIKTDYTGHTTFTVTAGAAAISATFTDATTAVLSVRHVDGGAGNHRIQLQLNSNTQDLYFTTGNSTNRMAIRGDGTLASGIFVGTNPTGFVSGTPMGWSGGAFSIGIGFGETVLITDNTYKEAMHIAVIGYKTAAAFDTAAVEAIEAECRVGSGNTQNWTLNPCGLIGVLGHPIVEAGAAGTITGVSSFQTAAGFSGGTITNYYGLLSRNPPSAGATLVNSYGVYIEAITGATTLNYAVYAAGGDNYFGGVMTITTPATANGVDALTINQGNHTSVAAEHPAIVVSAATMNLASGTTIAQYGWLKVTAPTFVGVAGGFAETVTDAATLMVIGAPIQGANATLTRTYQAWFQGTAELRIDTTTQDTVGAAGAASNIPASPTHYLPVYVGTTKYVLPLFANA